MSENQEPSIVDKVLTQLDDWGLKGSEDEDYLNKTVTSEEVLYHYDVAINYALSYTQLSDFDKVPISETALILWTAGLLWNKYNIKLNNQIDETYPVGYGDKLIIQAKEMLKPYKSYTLNIF